VLGHEFLGVGPLVPRQVALCPCPRACRHRRVPLDGSCEQRCRVSENATPPSSLQAQFRSDLALINDALDDLIAQALASRDEGPAPDPWPPPRKLPPGALWARFAAARALWARFAAAGQSLAWEPGV
jgi:hypothetical protein